MVSTEKPGLPCITSQKCATSTLRKRWSIYKTKLSLAMQSNNCIPRYFAQLILISMAEKTFVLIGMEA